MDWERERRSARPEDPAPGAHAEEHELLGRLRGMLGALPEIERQLVALYYGAGLTQEEIGAALALPQRTVSAKLKGSLDRLRKNLAGAGLAAAAPMLTDAALSDALSSGPEIPGGLLERTLARCDQPYAPRLTSRRSGRVAAAGSKAGLAIAAVVLAAIGAGAYALRQQTEPQDTTPASGAPATATSAAPRTWTFSFEEMPGEGFEYIQGTWQRAHLKNAGKTCLIAMDDSRYNAFLLPVLGMQRPFVVHVRYWTPRAGQMYFGIGSSNGLQSFGARKWEGELIKVYHDRPIDFDCYFYELYVVGRSGGKLRTLSQESEDTEHVRLYISGTNIAIDSIEVRELRDDEVPEDVRNVASLIRERGKSTGEQKPVVWGEGVTKPLAQYLKETKQPKKP